jgi:hypothetical protein
MKAFLQEAYRGNIDFKTVDNIFYKLLKIIAIMHYLVFMLINEADLML